MPRLTHRLPSLRKHPNGQACTKIDGRVLYFGAHGTKAAKAEYDRVIGEWVANGRRLPASEPDALTVSEVVLAFWRHAQRYYGQPGGKVVGELSNYRDALRPLRKVYGATPAAEFGSLALEALRDGMIRAGVARTTINRRVGRIRHVFKWAASKQLVPVAAHQALTTVDGLKRGRSDARETGRVLPVADDVLDATLPNLSRTIRAMVELQLLTGARPGEVCQLRGDGIDRTDANLWTCRLVEHKTAHHDQERVLYFGRKAQEVLTPFLLRCGGGFVFSPAQAEAERLAARAEARRTPRGQGNAPGTNRTRRPRRTPGERYDVHTYRRAVTRACECAFTMPAELRDARDDTAEARGEKRRARSAWRAAHVWSPGQLRHNAATRLRAAYGLEAAQVILGHRLLTTTQVYAERDTAKAKQVMREVG